MDVDTNQSVPENLFPIVTDCELGLPLDNAIRIVFTGYFNGVSVEIRAQEEITLLYHMGCFGKGSVSKSKPTKQGNVNAEILRKRQFAKRISWFKRFNEINDNSEESAFLDDIDKLTSKILESAENVIDLVSSDDDTCEISLDTMNTESNRTSFRDRLDNILVVVPNSDSEGENYFEKFKPKCCINKVKLQEKLILTLQEAYFLAYGLGCLQVIDYNGKCLSLDQSWELFRESDKTFVLKYIVYHYFRSKGYIVKPGIKFGGDYLLYKDGPALSHADYIVVMKNDEAQYQIDWIAMLGHVRMAVTTGKEIILAEVVHTKDISHITPQDLSTCRVREILLKRNFPVTINEDID